FFEQRENSANWRCEDDDITAQYRFLDISTTAINRAARYGYVQHLKLVAAHNCPLESPLAESESERAADQAGSYDRDLPNRHGERVGAIRSSFPPREQSCATGPSV